MKKHIHFFCLIVISGIFTNLIYAQPVITSVNMPVAGDSIIIARCNNPVEPGPAGESQTWDMSHLSESEEGYFKFMMPSQSPFGYLFPQADICGKSWTDSYSFYGSDAGSLAQLGNCLLLDTIAPPDDTVKSVYSDSEVLFNFPFSYNDMHTDVFAGTNYALGFSEEFTGDISVEADGYGTLILPNATYNNVLRYHFDRNQSGDFSPDQYKEQWGWISEDHTFWLLLMETITTSLSTTSLVWYNKQPDLVLSVPPVSNPSITLYPNPIRPGDQLSVFWHKTGPVSIGIYDMTGKRLTEETRILTAGKNILNASQIIDQPGIYIVKLQNVESNFNCKVVVSE